MDGANWWHETRYILLPGIRQALSTVLIVTQRVATIKNADQIVVLDEGNVVGKGRHSELMENCETYREIALSQLSLEELS